MREYILGIDWAEERGKSVYIIIPGSPKDDLSRDIELVRRRVAEAVKVPIELIDPGSIRLCEHPAFRNGTVIRFASTEE